MEEKKLTDEEIVKALECCAVEPCEDCGNCPRFTKEKLCHKANAKQSLDLIRRLQSENERLTKKRKYILANKVYTDSTLKTWKKEDLIEQIRILEHNWACAEEGLNIQAKNCEMLLQKAVKDTAKEIYKEIGKGDILVVQTQEYGEIEVVPIERLKEIIKQKGVEVE